MWDLDYFCLVEIFIFTLILGGMKNNIQFRRKKVSNYFLFMIKRRIFYG